MYELYLETLRCICIQPSFYAMFSKGDNFCDFLFAFLEVEVFPKWGLLLRKEFAPIGANNFLYKMTPIYMGYNNENDRVDAPESIPMD